jgi:type VI secretion system protein ImpH
MAGDRGPAADALIRRLGESPHEFDVFQALRRLEATRPDLPPIGTSLRLREDAVMFCQAASLRFASSTIEELRWVRGSGVPRLVVNHFGLLGPNGALPLHLTELAYTRVLHHKDATLSSFLDVFNHRMIQLLYRAWAVNQITVSHQQSALATERAGASGEGARGRDPYEEYVGAFFGYGGRSTFGDDREHDLAKLFFAGRLASPSRNPEGLASLLRAYLRVPVEIEEFVGRWIDLPEQYRCRLGLSPLTSSLGGTKTQGMAGVGSQVWDCQGKVRVVLGPMDLDDYKRLLPVYRQGLDGGRSFRRLEAWCRHYLGEELDFDVRLILKKDQVPKSRLGGRVSDASAAQLGWTSFAATGAAAKDAELVVAGRSLEDDFRSRRALVGSGGK